MNIKEMRKDLLKMAYAAKSKGAHLGGSLSMVEIMAALYDGVMNFDCSNFGKEERDRLILSKGHGVMAQYVALKQCGVISDDQLLTYKSNNSVISAHPFINPNFGFDFASGSLGQGLSLGVGVALALLRKENTKSRVFVVVGDGECDEGSVWESAMCAAHYRLRNIVLIVDRNGLQYDGKTEDILALEDLSSKFRSFGWCVDEVNGHDVNALIKVLSVCAVKPHVVIANTVKGKGISFMENNPKWHNGVLSQKLYMQALNELGVIE